MEVLRAMMQSPQGQSQGGGGLSQLFSALSQQPTGMSGALTGAADPAPHIVGYLPNGRPVVQNADGSKSTHRNMIANWDKHFYIVPTMYKGRQVSEDEAAAIIEKNNFVDPDTGEKLQPYPSLEAAQAVEKKWHAMMEQQSQFAQPGGR